MKMHTTDEDLFTWGRLSWILRWLNSLMHAMGPIELKSKNDGVIANM